MQFRIIKEIVFWCLLIFLLYRSLVYAFDGKCPICVEEGKKSIVTIGACYSTLLYCGNGHYDEDGNYHFPEDCNTTTCNFTCSNGHKFTDKL